MCRSSNDPNGYFYRIGESGNTFDYDNKELRVKRDKATITIINCVSVIKYLLKSISILYKFENFKNNLFILCHFI